MSGEDWVVLIFIGLIGAVLIALGIWMLVGVIQEGLEDKFGRTGMLILAAVMVIGGLVTLGFIPAMVHDKKEAPKKNYVTVVDSQKREYYRYPVISDKNGNRYVLVPKDR